MRPRIINGRLETGRQRSEVRGQKSEVRGRDTLENFKLEDVTLCDIPFIYCRVSSNKAAHPKENAAMCDRGIFEVRPDSIADSWSAKDGAENATAAIVAAAVVPVSVTGVLSIALVVALHEAITKGLRRSLPVVV